MLKKTITYEDYDGNERTEDFFFHLTKAELIEMDLSEAGGLDRVIEKITQTKDVPKLISLFKEIIVKSYGEKSMDGKRFIKNEELTTSFLQTNAYSQLYIELLSDIDKAVAFIQGIVPADVAAAAKENTVSKIDELKAKANVDSLIKSSES